MTIAIEPMTVLTPKDLGQRWDYDRLTLANWRSAGTGPVYSKIGRKVIYLMKDVEEYERARIVAPLN